MFYAHEYFINVNAVVSLFAAMMVVFALCWPAGSLVRRLSIGLAGSLLIAVNFLHMLILFNAHDQLVIATDGDIPLSLVTKLLLSMLVMSIAVVSGFWLLLLGVAKRRV